MYRTYYDPEKRIWSGRKTAPFYHPDVSIGQAVLFSLERSPNNIGQISDNSGVCLTNREIRLRSIRVAQKFLSLNFKQRDVVGIIAKNTENLAPVVFGCFICGLPINTLDPSFGCDEIIHMYGQTKPKVIFCDTSNYETVRKSIDLLNLHCLIYLIDGQIPGVESVDFFLEETGNEEEFMSPNLERGGREIAALMCSSGTTGRPKAVCLSHAVLLDGHSAKYFSLCCSHEVSFCFSTLYWVSGLVTLLYTTLDGAPRVITSDLFSADLLLKIIEKYKVTSLFTPPSHATLALQSPLMATTDFGSLKSYALGGSLVPKALLESLSEYIPKERLKIGYGMTEIGRVLSGNLTGTHLDSVGQLVSNSEVRIIDDDGNNLGIGEAGEICIRFSNIFSGYYNNPGATKETLDSEGWVHSGDIGYFDTDGYLYISDRKKEIIKYKNYHVFPTEIEQEIYNIPGVEMVCVCGIPDPVATDLPTAAVIRKSGSNLVEKDILEHIKKTMSPHKQLTGGVYFFKSFPMTASGKIQKRSVREMLIKMCVKC